MIEYCLRYAVLKYFLCSASWVVKCVYYYYLAPAGVRNIAISVSVCLHVCLYVSLLAHLKNHIPDFTKFFVHVICVVARSSSDHNAIRYILPVLWMTSRLPIMSHMMRV